MLNKTLLFSVYSVLTHQYKHFAKFCWDHRSQFQFKKLIINAHWPIFYTIKTCIAENICEVELKNLDNAIISEHWKNAELYLLIIKNKIGYFGNLYTDAAANFRYNKYCANYKDKK